MTNDEEYQKARGVAFAVAEIYGMNTEDVTGSRLVPEYGIGFGFTFKPEVGRIDVTTKGATVRAATGPRSSWETHKIGKEDEFLARLYREQGFTLE